MEPDCQVQVGQGWKAELGESLGPSGSQWLGQNRAVDIELMSRQGFYVAPVAQAEASFLGLRPELGDNLPSSGTPCYTLQPPHTLQTLSCSHNALRLCLSLFELL